VSELESELELELELELESELSSEEVFLLDMEFWLSQHNSGECECGGVGTFSIKQFPIFRYLMIILVS
jgi:hypothetical protein